MDEAGLMPDGRALRELLGDDWLYPWWAEVPPRLVDPAVLVPTQWPHYWPCRLAGHRIGAPVEGADPHPHLVAWRQHLYVWDGHTRVARWLKDAVPRILARTVAVA